MKSFSKSKRRLTLTVGITTCYGGSSILETVKSVRTSKGIGNFRFIIVADRVPITCRVKTVLKKYSVELIENKKESGQVTKQRQILAMCKTDIIIFTNDDVLFEPYTLAKIMERFEAHCNTTFISVRKQPVPATSLFEDIATVGTNIVNRIIRDWKSGDNYLSSIGRCLAFRTKWIKRFNIPDEVVSTDSYSYIKNKRMGGVFEYITEVAILYKKTQKLNEHLRKSSRFQHQKQEMSRYFGDLNTEYKIPKWILTKSAVGEFLHNPIKFILFLGVYLYTRIFKISIKQSLNPVWEVDFSTKKI